MPLRALVSFALMQGGWFACVLGAVRGYPSLGPLVVLLSLALHVRAQPATARTPELLVLVLAALLGFVVDTALLRAGVLAIAGAAVSPPWLVALWPNLAAATGRGGSLGWLERRRILGAVLGAVAGPGAYVAGQRLGVLAFGESRTRALVIIGASWFFVLPSFQLFRRWVTTKR